MYTQRTLARKIFEDNFGLDENAWALRKDKKFRELFKSLVSKESLKNANLPLDRKQKKEKKEKA